MKKPTRKSFNVKAFRDKINWRLMNCTMPEDGLKELCLTLEDVLHDTGNYGGFRYLGSAEVPTGELPGIRITNRYDDPQAQFVNVNEYRRKYF